jgi:ABC-type nitrate/sulfonate/bicarbonate transport system ATPase subunit
MSPLVTLNKVHKSFHHLPVLQGIDCQVGEGEVVSIIGPSGCGKSTLLRLISGVERPDRGQVERRFRRVGFVFQEARLLLWRTALENVTLVLLDTITDRDRREARVRDLLARLGLSGFEHYYPAQLSGGMRQRVAIARALAVEPDLLLLDEPFAGLDFALRMRTIDFLHRLLEEEGRTAVYVTHDVREALALGDRLVLLSARPARVRHVFDLRGKPRDGWRLGPGLRQIEDEVMTALLGEFAA